MELNSKVSALNSDIRDNYLIRRPKAPVSLFDRIFSYHQSKDSAFGTVHDVGAGNGPYAQKLRSRFSRVIVSDIVADNVELARRRLAGSPEGGFSFRVAKLQDWQRRHGLCHERDALTRPAGRRNSHHRAPATVRRAVCRSHEGERQLLEGTDDPGETICVMGRRQGTVKVILAARR